jgi:hypothetical protein
MQTPWHGDVARHLIETAESLKSGNMVRAQTSLGTALGYLLRAAGNGDDGAFDLIKLMRTSIDDAEPTQVIDFDRLDRS